MPWPTKSRTTPHPWPSTYSWMAAADVPEACAVLHLLDPDLERPPRDFDDVPCLWARGPDVERRARVAVEPLVYVGHVDVHDVAVLEHGPVRNPVADDVVDARADALGKALVVKGSGASPLPQGILVHDAVDVLGRHPDSDLLADEQERLRRQAADGAHQIDLSGALDVDRHCVLSPLFGRVPASPRRYRLLAFSRKRAPSRDVSEHPREGSPAARPRARPCRPFRSGSGAARPQADPPRRPCRTRA